ncbi:MAG: hypothetical protein BGO39_11075 [Chloroflexi bacterium 54-19]|nr:MAG: hypothetical protein BGO39_11075 [Chloroflexi bacterium 54-19]
MTSTAPAQTPVPSKTVFVVPTAPLEFNASAAATASPVPDGENALLLQAKQLYNAENIAKP